MLNGQPAMVLVMNQSALNPNVLTDILRCPSGSVSFADLHSLATLYPDLPIGVKMGMSPRFMVNAARVEMLVANRVNSGDYVREMFIPADSFDALRKVFQIV